jgi:hypothetical protein
MLKQIRHWNEFHESTLYIELSEPNSRILSAYLGTLNLLAVLKLKLPDQSPLSTRAQYLHKQAMNEFIKAVIVLRKYEVKSKIASSGSDRLSTCGNTCAKTILATAPSLRCAPWWTASAKV